MTRQEIFNRSYLGVIGQGGPSNEETHDGWGPRCRYRSPEGRRCAIGQLISNEHYSSDLEGQTPGDAPVSAALHLSGVRVAGRGDLRFFDALQCAHDLATFSSDEEFLIDFRRNMAEVAKSFRLKVPE